MAHNHKHHDVSGRRLAWAIVFNALITAAEFIGGLVTGYLALTADAVHNLSDVVSLGLAWLGLKGSRMPATKRSTYGLGRLEVMTAFISAAALVVIAVFILLEAWDRLLNPQPITRPWLFMSVAVIGLIGNVVSIALLHSEKGKSLNMKMAFLHMAYDTASSVAVIIGGLIIAYAQLYIVDVILSAIIALMIFWSSYLVIREAVMIFLESAPQGIDFDEVFRSIRAVPEVADVHDLHIWSLSSSDIALSCHICVGEDNIGNGPDIVGRVNKLLCEKFNIEHSTVQLETLAFRRPDALCSHNNEHRKPK